MFFNTILVGLLACSVAFAALPTLTKCKLEDGKCITASTKDFIATFAEGNQEWGVDTLDPFNIKYLDASSPQLKLKLNDVTVSGLKQCIPKKIEFNQAQSELFLKFQCTVTLDGHYVMNGSIIVLPIRGDGRIHVVLRKAIISAKADVEKVTGKDGLAHLSLKRYSHTYELKDKATIDLDNLFNGNEELGRVIKELFETSPNEVVTEVAPPIVQAVVDKIAVMVNRFFKKFSIKDLTEN